MPTESYQTGLTTKTWLRRFKGSSSSAKKTVVLNKKKSFHLLDVSVLEEIVEMGKSNKFDYTNRVNSGAKLGQIIGSSLQKEAEKVKKDAERLLQKARKQSNDSGSGGTDTNSHTEIIDLKAPNKDLTDDGVCALVDGLEIALRSGTSQASLALEDLNISGNSMTTRSLARLAPVIELAKYDLKTLNLADNKIKVQSNEEAAQWAAFLMSFQGCMKLRRLDLSGNGELGSRAMEVLARVHIAEQSIIPIPPRDITSSLSLIDEHEEIHQADSPDAADEKTGLGIGFQSGMANGRMIMKRRGLRSIPYITLNLTGLDDAGAVWLSYVLEDHFYPNQLIDELNATRSDSVISAYQQDTNFQGLDWSDNKTLGKEGRQLLERTEALRRQMLLDDRTTMAGSMVMSDTESALEDGGSSRRTSLEQDSLKPRPAGRRISVRSIRTADGGEHESTELESSRKRLKRYIIAHDGSSSVELWHSALKLFRASRALLCISPVNRKYYTGPPLFDIPNLRSLTSNNLAIANDKAKLHVDTTRAVSHLSPNRASYASKLSPVSSNGTDSAVTEVTNTPTTPMVLQRPGHRKGAFSEDEDYFQETNKNLSELKIGRERSRGVPSRLQYIKFQQDKLTKADVEDRKFRDTSIPCNFPLDVIHKIMGFVLTTREISVMSSEQQRIALNWGQSKETLMMERDWVKKDESAQVLMLLDNINCLAYQH